MAPRKNSKRTESSSDSGPDDTGPLKPAAKKTKTSSSTSKPDDEEHQWCLDKMRFVKVREFKGKIMVDIREFYQSDGELKPGRKGISLSINQWKKLVENIDEIEEAIKQVS